jgi:hypothetical protein
LCTDGEGYGRARPPTLIPPIQKSLFTPLPSRGVVKEVRAVRISARLAAEHPVLMCVVFHGLLEEFTTRHCRRCADRCRVLRLPARRGAARQTMTNSADAHAASVVSWLVFRIPQLCALWRRDTCLQSHEPVSSPALAASVPALAASSGAFSRTHALERPSKSLASSATPGNASFMRPPAATSSSAPLVDICLVSSSTVEVSAPRLVGWFSASNERTQERAWIWQMMGHALGVF